MLKCVTEVIYMNPDFDGLLLIPAGANQRKRARMRVCVSLHVVVQGFSFFFAPLGHLQPTLESYRFADAGAALILERWAPL